MFIEKDRQLEEQGKNLKGKKKNWDRPVGELKLKWFVEMQMD